MPTLPYSLSESVAPAVEPVSVDEAKRNSDEDDNYRDADFARWITEARRQVEHDARISLITRTNVLKLDSFPDCDFIELPMPPAIAVSSITYLDTDGDSQTWASSSYTLDANRTPGVVFLDYLESYPLTRGDRNSVTVTYTAGYGTAPSSVPGEAKSAILLLVKQRYDNPDSVGNPMGYDALIQRLGWGAYP